MNECRNDGGMWEKEIEAEMGDGALHASHQIENSIFINDNAKWSIQKVVHIKTTGKQTATHRTGFCHFNQTPRRVSVSVALTDNYYVFIEILMAVNFPGEKLHVIDMFVGLKCNHIGQYKAGIFHIICFPIFFVVVLISMRWVNNQQHFDAVKASNRIHSECLVDSIARES